MKKIVNLRIGDRFFSIINYKKGWKEYGNKPELSYRTNGFDKKLGHTCKDITLTIGYTVFNYTNFNA